MVELTSLVWYDFFTDVNKITIIKSLAKIVLKVDLRNVSEVLIGNLEVF